ncbi:hypothetical protein IFM89_034656 [Coptis chinensis]|uniref:FBD domain-containing protein n=1 Tax=Coptis chinensis TaxID=261450 RepID=A0A835LSK3_9MAGN|nr:hypothetical protein IFM89_034656 [Coptis chinensis]
MVPIIDLAGLVTMGVICYWFFYLNDGVDDSVVILVDYRSWESIVIVMWNWSQLAMVDQVLDVILQATTSVSRVRANIMELAMCTIGNLLDWSNLGFEPSGVFKTVVDVGQGSVERCVDLRRGQLLKQLFEALKVGLEWFIVSLISFEDGGHGRLFGLIVKEFLGKDGFKGSELLFCNSHSLFVSTHHSAFSSDYLMANQQGKVKGMRTSVDRISRLHDCVLHHLLSFLPTNYVVQTCVLSKRWKDLWHSIPSLDFDQTQFLVLKGRNQNTEGPITFSKFIDTVLLLRDYSGLLKLGLSWGHIKDDPSRINLWIIAAARRNVQSLDLKIVNVDSFELTPRLHTCKSLRELKLSLSYALVSPLSLACISSLQVLRLEHVTFVDNEQTNALFSSALPVLKTLILDNCDFRNHELLKITAQQLKILFIKQCLPKYSLLLYLPFGIEVSAPSLVSIELYLEDFGEECVLDNLISLVNAKIHLVGAWCEINIEGLRYAQSISLSRDCMVACEYSAGDSNLHKTFFNNLKWLKLGIAYKNADIAVLTTMSKLSRNSFVGDQSGYNFSMRSLKSVKIQNFRGWEYEIKFVQFLLKSAKSLEKMSIVTQSSGEASMTKTELRKIGDMLLTYPRASSSLGILFM